MSKRSIRFIASCAVAYAALAGGDTWAQTPFTTGGAEVRGFVARSATSALAATYGGGLFASTDTGASFARNNTIPGNVRYLTSIAGNSSFVILGADEGLLRSTNGTTFTRSLYEPVAAVAIGNGTSTTVLAAVKGVGILRSMDGGLNFGAASNGAFDSTDMSAVVFHPADPSIAYAASLPDRSGARGGVWRSVDGGATWTSYFATGIPNKYVMALAVDSSGRVYAGTFDPNSNDGRLYQRASGAGAWTEATGLFSGVASLHVDANSSTKIWAGSTGFGILSGTAASVDYAWPLVAQPNKFFTGINAILTFPGNANVALKAIKGTGVWRSTTNVQQRTWARLGSTAFPNGDRVRAMAPVGGNPAGRLVGLHAGGVWRSTDSGGTYNEGFTVNGTTVNDFSFAGSNAAHYTNTFPFVTVWELAADATNPNLVYAAAGGVGIFYRNDNAALFKYNGTAWGPVGNNATGGGTNGVVEGGALTVPSQQVYGVAMNPGDSNQVYASFLGANGGTPIGLLRRGGGTWIQETMQGLSPQVRAVIPSTANPLRLLALPFGDKPNISTNAGDTWTAVSVSQAGFEFLRFFSAAESPTTSSVWIAGTNKGIFRSTDSGASWARISMATPFAQVVITAVGFKTTGRAFAADTVGNRYCSADNGATWVSAGVALRAGVNAIKRIGTELYYLTDGAGMQREDGTC